MGPKFVRYLSGGDDFGIVIGDFVIEKDKQQILDDA